MELTPQEQRVCDVFSRHDGRGTSETARQKMIDRYGTEWGFQYSEKRWQEWLERKPEYIPAETEMEVIK